MFCNTEVACDTRLAGTRAEVFGSVGVAVTTPAVATAAVWSAACAGRPRESGLSLSAYQTHHMPRAPPGQPVPGLRNQAQETMLGPALLTTGPDISDQCAQQMIVMTMLTTIWPHVTKHGASV